MAREPRTIVVEPGSELYRILGEAADEPVELRRNGVRYRVSRLATGESDKKDIWAGYDPERVRASLRSVAGTLSDDEADAMIEYIYRGREEGNRPMDRPSPWPT